VDLRPVEVSTDNGATWARLGDVLFLAIVGKWLAFGEFAAREAVTRIDEGHEIVSLHVPSFRYRRQPEMFAEAPPLPVADSKRELAPGFYRSRLVDGTPCVRREAPRPMTADPAVAEYERLERRGLA